MNPDSLYNSLKRYAQMTLDKTDYMPKYKVKEEKKIKKDKWAIFDIDGCLVDDEWRKHGTKKQYDKSFLLDKPIKKNVKILRRLLDDGFRIAFLTGRSVEFSKETIDYIDNKIIPDYETDYCLYMRDYDCKRPSQDLKHIQLDQLIEFLDSDDYKKESRSSKEGGEIIYAFDNKIDNCEMFEDHGIDSFLLDKYEYIRIKKGKPQCIA